MTGQFKVLVQLYFKHSYKGCAKIASEALSVFFCTSKSDPTGTNWPSSEQGQKKQALQKDQGTHTEEEERMDGSISVMSAGVAWHIHPPLELAPAFAMLTMPRLPCRSESTISSGNFPVGVA